MLTINSLPTNSKSKFHDNSLLIQPLYNAIQLIEFRRRIEAIKHSALNLPQFKVHTIHGTIDAITLRGIFVRKSGVFKSAAVHFKALCCSE